MTLRKIAEASDMGCTVKVYRDAEWQEYRVRSYISGILLADADYHTSDRQDAMDSMTGILTRLLKQSGAI